MRETMIFAPAIRKDTRARPHMCIYIHIYVYTHIYIYTYTPLLLTPLLPPPTPSCAPLAFFAFALGNPNDPRAATPRSWPAPCQPSEAAERERQRRLTLGVQSRGERERERERKRERDSERRLRRLRPRRALPYGSSMQDVLAFVGVGCRRRRRLDLQPGVRAGLLA